MAVQRRKRVTHKRGMSRVTSLQWTANGISLGVALVRTRRRNGPNGIRQRWTSSSSGAWSPALWRADATPPNGASDRPTSKTNSRQANQRCNSQRTAWFVGRCFLWSTVTPSLLHQVNRARSPTTKSVQTITDRGEIVTHSRKTGC